jgi:uncharacterized membrane-anchored protein YitT (DUF2179 family)
MSILLKVKGIHIPENLEKLRPTKKDIREHITIVFGLMLYALAWKGFLLPHQIPGGGVTGIGALLYFAWNIPVSITYFAINVVLLIIAIRSIGVSFSLRTIFGVAVLTLLFSIIPIIPKGTFVGPNESFMACVLGSILAGAGVGLVFISNGSSGGTDIIAKILNQSRNITLGRALLYCDVIIISASYLILGSMEKVVYGLVMLTISSVTVDMVVNGVRQSVQFFIISREYEKIADRINVEIYRGVTILNGEGWYSKDPVKVIMVIARKNQSVAIFRLVKQIDPDAFVSQGSVIGVYGRGFEPFKVK